MYQAATITDVLRKEQCPDNLSEMKQPSVFEIDTPKTQPMDSEEDYQNKSIDRLDETSDEINGWGSNNKGQWSSSNSKFSWDHKKSSNKKHQGHSSDSNRPTKKDYSGHPKGKSKSDSYDSSDPFSSSGETDNLDYPYESRSSQPPISRPKKHAKSGKFKQSGSKFDKSDPYGYGKQSGLYESSSYNFNTNPPLTSNESVGSPVRSESFNNPKRPGRSPYPGSLGQNAYPYPTDILDSDESSGKRVPRRGDIGIQSLDEKGR